jgi:hypothetical protein
MRGEAMTTIYVPSGLISVPTEAVERVENWAIWVRPRLGLDSHERCASAEGRYESSGGGSVSRCDLQAVLAVERIVSMKLTRTYRELIRRHFVFKHDARAITVHLSIHRSQYGLELKRAVLMVKNNLTQF